MAEGPEVPPGLQEMLGGGGFPPGADPETYRIGEVTRLLREASYFSIFSVPDPSRPNRPVNWPSWFPWSIVAVHVHEELHRFDLTVEAGEDGCRLEASQRIGRPAARVQIRWTVIPEWFAASPDRRAPPTPLLPFVSQRFAMLDGELRFRDAHGSGFRGFGTGRTFPASVRGERRLRIGAVIDVLEGFGSLEGLPGTVCVNGYIEPPDGLALNLMARFVDPEGRLRTRTPGVIQGDVDPDPDAVFLAVLGEPDPDRPTRLVQGADGAMLGAEVHELLRPVRTGFDLDGPMSSETRTGPVAGTVSGRLLFDPLRARSGGPVPFGTRGGVFTLQGRDGAPVGSIKADVTEGRGFPTELPGAPMPVFRFGGFGPVLGGDGLFAGVEGMMTLNAAISIFPRTLSNLYVFRLSDPSGRLRRGLSRAA